MEPSSQQGAPQQQPIMATSIATSIATTLPRSILREPPPLLPTMATSTATAILPRSIPPEPPPLSSIPEPPPLLPKVTASTPPEPPTSTATPILPRRIPPETPPLEVSGTHFPLISIISKRISIISTTSTGSQTAPGICNFMYQPRKGNTDGIFVNCSRIATKCKWHRAITEPVTGTKLPCLLSAQFFKKSTGSLTTLNPLQQHRSLFVTLHTNQENVIKTELLSLSTVVD